MAEDVAQQRLRLLWIVGAGLLLAIAFTAAPKSCQGGLSFYFWSGIVIVIAQSIGTYVLARTRRVALAAAAAVSGIALWIAGIFAANFQIMCRLF